VIAKPAQDLFELQELDIQLVERRAKLRKAESLLAETDELLGARNSEADATVAATAAKEKLRDLEDELQTVVDKLAAAEAKLYDGKVANPKELGNLQQDQAQLARARANVEDQVLDAMGSIEQRQQGLTDATARRGEVERTWQAVHDRAAVKVSQLTDQVTQLAQERDKVVARVPQQALMMYLDLQRKKGGRAVALLVGQVCQGCRVSLPYAKSQAAKVSPSLVTCPTCGRILLPRP
jgi:uncharacterized protein